MEMICLLGMGGGTSIIRFSAVKLSFTKFLNVIPCLITACTFGQKFVNACKIEKWAVVNFSARCNVRGLVTDLMRVGESKGIVRHPYSFDLFFFFVCT